MSNSLNQNIKDKSKKLGFLECRIIPAGFLSEEVLNLKNWLSGGLHGEMQYMSRNQEKRLDPGKLVDNAKTIIIILQNYYPHETQKDSEAPVLSKYAYGIDYHYVIKKKLNELFDFILEQISDCKGRIFVDSAPVLERAWARKAGLGWIGKNSNLISVKHGSFFFIGEVIIDKELPYDKEKEVIDHCGTCTRCIDSCPTNAIVAERVVDARKCISYQTIEKKGELESELIGRFENRIFGCDICQDVCPWNLKSKPHNELDFMPDPELLSLSKNEWYSMDESHFNRIFKKSAVKRTGYKGFKRNLEFLKGMKT